VRPVTVTPDAGQSKLLGTADPVLAYKVTNTLGLVSGDAFTGALSRASGEGVGNYAITQGDLALNTNYTITFTGGVLFSIDYRWDGFLQPINDTAHQIGTLMSQFKLGSTVPAKFQLKKADGTVVPSTATIAFSQSGNLGPCGAAVTSETVITEAATTGAAFRWDATAQQYIYNWSTKGLKAGKYRIAAVLDDPSGKTNSYVDICLG
jgi:hypothetical protein